MLLHAVPVTSDLCVQRKVCKMQLVRNPESGSKFAEIDKAQGARANKMPFDGSLYV